MSSSKRKMLDISVVPQKLNQFRGSNQGTYETSDAKAYAEYVAQDTDGGLSRLVTDKHLARTLSRNERREDLPIHLRSLERWQQENPRKMGGRIEHENIPAQSSPRDERTSQIVWIKFEAEKNLRDAAYQLIRLRRKLGLPIQLPIYGPGGKRILEQHLANARNEQSPNSDKSGIFYYCLLAARNKYSAPYNPYDLEI
ncbi:unnamed protein product, partial [Adineta steineri]